MRAARWGIAWLVVGVLAWGMAGSAGATETVRFPTEYVQPNTIRDFEAGGFIPGESISFWITAPSTAVTPLPILNANNQGFVIEPVSFPGGGFYQVTAHGNQSARIVIGGYSVDGVPDPTVGSIPIPVQQPLSFGARGFAPGEAVALTETVPDGAMIALGNISADSTGQVLYPTTFTTAGQYVISGRGTTSGVIQSRVYLAYAT